jgi:hypothetical protein
MREAIEAQYPSRDELLAYLYEVRALSRQRLEAASAADFDRAVHDEDFGAMQVRDVWAGVVTSFAWHAGQAAMTAKMLPETPISTLPFGSWLTQPDDGG